MKKFDVTVTFVLSLLFLMIAYNFTKLELSLFKIWTIKFLFSSQHNSSLSIFSHFLVIKLVGVSFHSVWTLRCSGGWYHCNSKVWLDWKIEVKSQSSTTATGSCVSLVFVLGVVNKLSAQPSEAYTEQCLLILTLFYNYNWPERNCQS